MRKQGKKFCADSYVKLRTCEAASITSLHKPTNSSSPSFFMYGPHCKAISRSYFELTLTNESQIHIVSQQSNVSKLLLFRGGRDWPSGRTQVLYKAHVLYCALFSGSCFFSLEIAKKCFFVLYFCKLFKWVEYLFQVFIYNTKIGEL